MSAILADGVDFCYKNNAIQTTYERGSYAFKINNINRSKYMGNIGIFDYDFLKKKTCV